MYRFVEYLGHRTCLRCWSEIRFRATAAGSIKKSGWVSLLPVRYVYTALSSEKLRFDCPKVRGVFLGEPFLKFGFGLGILGMIGQVVPLVGVLGHLVEFFASLAIMYVMKTLRANGMIGAMPVRRVGDHCGIGPLCLWIANQRDDASTFVLGVFR